MITSLFRPAWLILLLSISSCYAAHEGFLSGIDGQLLDREGKSTSSALIQKRKYLLIYFSAGWCPICKKFTPQLAKFYSENRKNGDFEVLFVSSDKSRVEMLQYWRTGGIPGLALEWACQKTKALTHEYGAENGGIPCMVLLDENDHLVASSFEGGKYLGPDAAIKKYLSLR